MVKSKWLLCHLVFAIPALVNFVSLNLLYYTLKFSEKICQLTTFQLNNSYVIIVKKPVLYGSITIFFLMWRKENQIISIFQIDFSKVLSGFQGSFYSNKTWSLTYDSSIVYNKLFRNVKFVFAEITKWNTSKFTVFLEYETSCFFFSRYLIFSSNEYFVPGLCRHREK